MRQDENIFYTVLPFNQLFGTTADRFLAVREEGRHRRSFVEGTRFLFPPLQSLTLRFSPELDRLDIDRRIRNRSAVKNPHFPSVPSFVRGKSERLKKCRLKRKELALFWPVLSCFKVYFSVCRRRRNSEVDVRDFICKINLSLFLVR